MGRREYKIKLVVNGRSISKVVIDPHYQYKHSRSIDDDLILRLVKLLDKGEFPAADTDGPFEYFVTDRLKLDNKFYKLVWLLEKNKLYIGVVNAYRRRK